MRTVAILLSTVAVLQACSPVGPDYEAPRIELSQAFVNGSSQELRDASRNMQALEYGLEFDAPDAITDAIQEAVRGYNEDDCLATLDLRDWLENLRAEWIGRGETIPRPETKDGDPSEKQTEILSRVEELSGKLGGGLPAYRAERTREQQAQWILAQLLEWHWREEKAIWWEYYRLLSLSEEELLDERAAIAQLQFVGRMRQVKKSFIDRYRFPPQETELRRGDELKMTRIAETEDGPVLRDRSFGSVDDVDLAGSTIDIKKGPSIQNQHPQFVFKHERVSTSVLSNALFRIGEWVAEHGIDAPGEFRAGRDLLLGLPPRLAGAPIEQVLEQSETPLDAALRLVLDLDCGLLPIQGPPGAGKTYTGGRMICEAVRAGLKVGITAVSHKVIRNLLDEAVEAAEELGVSIQCVQKVKRDSAEEDTDHIRFVKNSNGPVFEMLAAGKVQVAAGTAWLWSPEEATDSVDVLFVDEAGQISLANTVAVSQAARSLVLLGDPQQLEQPKRGSHPDGTAVSALEHLLGEHQTMPKDRGLFLETTWRLHPDICAFTSELFYESRLASREGLEQQQLDGASRFAGRGLYYVPVLHEGNCNESPEEAEAVAQIVDALRSEGASWIDQNGRKKPLTLRDILVVAPYNAHVASILERLPEGVRVGTVDRFQGQEAPVVIFSMGTSSPELAPRGMEFLYSPSRLNVATSRARCVCILVASSKLFEPECRTPRQMKLANAFCRYLEMASVVEA